MPDETPVMTTVKTFPSWPRSAIRANLLKRFPARRGQGAFGEVWTVLLRSSEMPRMDEGKESGGLTGHVAD